MPMLLTEAATEREKEKKRKKLVWRNTTLRTTENHKLFKKIWTRASAGSSK